MSALPKIPSPESLLTDAVRKHFPALAQKLTKPRIPVSLVQICTAYALAIDVRDMLAPRRGSPAVIQARHIAVYLAKKHTDCSFGSLAIRFRRSDHSTMMNSYNKVRDTMEKIPEYRAIVDGIETIILDIHNELVSAAAAHDERAQAALSAA